MTKKDPISATKNEVSYTQYKGQRIYRITFQPQYVVFSDKSEEPKIVKNKKIDAKKLIDAEEKKNG